MIRAQCLVLRGELVEALAVARLTVASGRQRDDKHMRSGSTATLGLVLLRLGRLEQARESLDESVGCAEEAHAIPEGIFGRGVRSLVRLRLGDIDGARDDARQAAAINANLPTAVYALEGYACAADTLVELWLGHGGDVRDVAASRKGFRAFVATFPVARARYQVVESVALAGAGREARAHRALDDVMAEAQRLGLPFERGCALRVRASLPGAEPDKARACLVEAKEVFARIGARRDAQEVDQRLTG